MFNSNLNLQTLNSLRANTLMETLGIEFLEIGDDFITAKMPVDHRTQQPFGFLHGGASLALAETLGSVAANFAIDNDKFICVGLEINANHLKPVSGGFVYGTTSPYHLGRTTQVWEIKIFNENKDLICISRHTVAIIPKNK